MNQCGFVGNEGPRGDLKHMQSGRCDFFSWTRNDVEVDLLWSVCFIWSGVLRCDTLQQVGNTTQVVSHLSSVFVFLNVGPETFLTSLLGFVFLASWSVFFLSTP